MSDSWIKLYDGTHEDPRVFRMGQLLSKTADRYITRHEARDLLGDVTTAVTRDALRDITIAGLARVWRAANRHTTDGTFAHADLEYLDTLAQIPGFGKAMAAVGWAVEHDGSVTLPNFTEHNTPDKNGGRAKTHAERQAAYRERKKQQPQPDPPSSDAENVTTSVTGDGRSDEKTSYSSSESESQSTDPEPEDNLTILDKAKGHINRLRQSWSRLPHWTAEEDAALFQSLPNLKAMEEQDWSILAYWLRWVHSAANTGSKEPLRVTSRRHIFVTELAAYLDRATAHWKQNGSPRLNRDGTKASKIVTFKPQPEPPPAPGENAFLGLLKAHGGKLPDTVATKPAKA